MRQLKGTNEEQVRVQLFARAVERAREYIAQDYTRVVLYEGLRTDFDLSGVVNQIRFQVGSNSIMQTVVGVGTTFDIGSPRTKSQRRLSKALKQAVKDAENRWNREGADG